MDTQETGNFAKLQQGSGLNQVPVRAPLLLWFRVPTGPAAFATLEHCLVIWMLLCDREVAEFDPE